MIQSKYKYLTIGVVLGIIITLVFIKIRDYRINSPENRKNAIIEAQRVIRKVYSEDKKDIRYISSTNPGIDFPPITKVKVEISEFKTYVIEMVGKYHSQRCVPYKDVERGCTYSWKDLFYVELDYNKGDWKTLDLRRIKRYE
ncbi:hypothetical protein [Aquimarina macrocephali]|uniref:hypothetical protein n=1 Tax=Aquimarina macrocephali TaxID=666563 RepID=UPI0004654B6A|nr:hypothetical protein [Aquimarina macrocephali]